MRILLIGDSILAGMAPYMASALAPIAPTSVVVESFEGATTTWWQSDGRIRDLVQRHRPDVVVVALGTNDGPRSMDAYRVVVANAIADAGMLGATVVWIGPFGGVGAAERWGVIRGLTDRSINGLELASGLPRVGVHFTQGGYRALADRVGRALGSVVGGVWESAPYSAPRRSLIGPIAAGGILGLLVLLLWE